MIVRAFSALSAIVVFGTLVPTALAAAPRFIIVAGPGLEEPVILDDWPENLRLLSATLDEGDDVDPASLANRPYLDVALLWGSWSRSEIDRIGAEEIAARGRGGENDRFYPAVDGQKAVIAIYLADRPGPREASPAVLDILARHGIPTVLPAEASGESRWPWITAGAVVAGASVLFGAGLLAFRRRSRPSAA